MNEIMDKQQQYKIVIEELWLNYYNDSLYAKHAITWEEYLKMKHMISSRSERKLRQIKKQETD